MPSGIDPSSVKLVPSTTVALPPDVMTVVSSGSVATVTAYCAAPGIAAQLSTSASPGLAAGVVNAVPSTGPVRFVTGAQFSTTVRPFVQAEVALVAVTLRMRHQ